MNRAGWDILTWANYGKAKIMPYFPIIISIINIDTYGKYPKTIIGSGQSKGGKYEENYIF